MSKVTKAEILERAKGQLDDLVELVSQLIKIPSENPIGSQRPVIDFVEKYLEDAGIDWEEVGCNEDFPCIVAHMGKEDGFSVILNGHVDVVPAGDREQWDFDPFYFYQVNHAQAQRLYELAVSQAAISKADTVLDLYCGVGTITLVMAKAAGRAIGVEVVPQAVEDARENAARNGIQNAEFFCADAGQAALELEGQGVRPDVIVVDPPRKGLSGDAIEAIARMSPRRLVYVSCDPATLARDVALLKERGYALKAAQAADLFPRCAHVETVCLLSRNK